MTPHRDVNYYPSVCVCVRALEQTLIERWSAEHAGLKAALTAAARRVDEFQLRELQTDRYTALAQSFAQWMESVSPRIALLVRLLFFLFRVCIDSFFCLCVQQTLSAVFDMGQTVAFRTPQFDEIKFLSRLLFAGNDTNYTVRA